MQKPIASIIVPALNEEQFIERSLKALLTQSVPREQYEIIVSDSSSTDSTIEIAKRYADKVVFCKKHSAGFGRNNGAKHAKSELIGFVDADTIVEHTWVEGLIEALGKGVGCTGPIESLEKDSLQMNLFYRWWSLQSRVSVMLHYPIFPGFNTGVRKKEFNAVSGYSIENITTEDIELGQKLNQVGKIVFSPKMKVKTSTRRLQEISLSSYIWNGIRFVLIGKSRGWEQHRKNF